MLSYNGVNTIIICCSMVMKVFVKIQDLKFSTYFSTFFLKVIFLHAIIR